MLFTHGWGGNRFQHQDKMEYSVELFNLVCVSVEYRQSGYDFDSVKGQGSYRPYDGSFMQVFDVLNGLRKVLELYPAVNRKRLFHYGGSQGGHITLLSSIFAPNTFAFVYASCPLTRLTEPLVEWTGRCFEAHELSVRNVLERVDSIKCPLYIEHGTADETIPHDEHSEKLERELKRHNKEFVIKCYEGGHHSLEPAITKLDAFKIGASTRLDTFLRDCPDDFRAGRNIEIDCGTKILSINWDKPTESMELFSWVSK
jgi:dienelactone hydrolase